MKNIFAISAMAVGLPFFAGDALAQSGSDYGKAEYESNCASCHGLSGKGDGPLARIYFKKTVDLTTLAKKNGGVFPAQRVFEVIDGRQEVKAHGPREMPVWGRDYRKTVPDLLEQGFTNLRDALAHTKLVSLVDYPRRIQEK